MGEHADDILEGFVCEECGMVIDNASPGYPRKCGACKPQPKENMTRPKKWKRRKYRPKA
jgi:hypothetical protein